MGSHVLHYTSLVYEHGWPCHSVTVAMCMIPEDAMHTFNTVRNHQECKKYQHLWFDGGELSNVQRWTSQVAKKPGSEQAKWRISHGANQ